MRPTPCGCTSALFFQYSPNCLFCGNTASVPPAAHFFCCARKSRQKEALGDASYCALTRAILWPLRGLNALFGRRIAIFPTAYSSDECTTHSCGQTVSISVLLISGILGQSHSCTAPCRDRCRHRPLQTFTKKRTGGQSRPPLQRICTTGESADALLFPQQRVLPSPCAATATDGSVVTKQAAR